MTTDGQGRRSSTFRSLRCRACLFSQPPRPIPRAIPRKCLRSDRAALQTPTQVDSLALGQPEILSSAAGDGITLLDPDAGPLGPTWNLTLSVSTGTLTLSGTAGLTGTGERTGSLYYSGTLSAINAALDDLTFTPAAGASGIPN